MGYLSSQEVARGMKSDFIIALTQLAAERNLPREIVLSAIEAALASAYKRDSIAAGQNISVKLDPGSGDVSVFVVKTVVEEVEDSQFEISLADARKIQRDAEIDDLVRTESLPHSAGRIAAQTAKQVVMQRLREAERDLVFKEFSDKEGEVFTVTVQKIEPRQVTVEMGRAEAVLPHSEQPMYERYRVGQKVKVLLQSIRHSNEGPELIVSRADQMLLRRLFEMEVPEIYSGAVEIVDIAREAGSRSKVAVFAKQEGVDAVGSCVGLRGIRIQNIVNELHGEKIDVVPWAKDPKAYITRALSPSQVMRVKLDEDEQAAIAVVPENQLSLAIGKEGQNARLAAKLTSWKVEIKSNVEMEEIEQAEEEARLKAAAEAPDEPVVEVAEEAVEAPAAIVEVTEEAVAEEAVVAAELEEPVTEEPAAEEPAAAEEPEEPEEDAPAAEVEEPEPEEEPEVLEEVVLRELLSEVEEDEQPQKEEALVGAAETATSIEDLSEDVWSVRNVPAAQPGVIRFREDIAELDGPDGPRRGRRRRRRGGAGQQNRRR
jgi:N utilization substance protein A